jgi:hypothetical protein
MEQILSKQNTFLKLAAVNGQLTTESLANIEEQDEKLVEQNEKIITLNKELLNYVKSQTKSFSVLTELSKQQNKITQMFSLRNMLDTTGLVRKNSGGIVDRILKTREERREYIRSSMELRPEVAESEGRRGAANIFANEFREKKTLEDKISKLDSKIDKFKQQGFSESIITNSPVYREKLNLLSQYEKKYAPFSEQKLTQEGIEESIESDRQVVKQTELLEMIEQNTRESVVVQEEVKDKPGVTKLGFLGSIGAGAAAGGFISNIFGSITRTFASVFSPRMLLSALTRVAPVAILVTSLGNAFYDAAEEFAKSGSILESIKTFVGSLVEFLTFGLIDQDTVTSAIDSLGGKIQENIITPLSDVIKGISNFINDSVLQPIKNFFSDSVTGLMNALRGVGIPEFKINLPWVVGGPRTIGPWYPFADTVEKNVATTGTRLTERSAAVENLSNIKLTANPIVTVAPTVNNSQRMNISANAPLRNQELSFNNVRARSTK